MSFWPEELQAGASEFPLPAFLAVLLVVECKPQDGILVRRNVSNNVSEITLAAGGSVRENLDIVVGVDVKGSKRRREFA